MGAAGRDFHDFACVFRDDPGTRVVAFTAAQIPGIEDRTFPASMSGSLHPRGIPIVAEERLEEVVAEAGVDEVVLSYSDLSHVDVMHRASRVLAAGASFRLLNPDATMIRCERPVVAVCATRTGSGKSQTSRAVAAILRGAGLRVVLVRHPMPYGDLEAARVQRFATIADIDAAEATVEEREEYEEPVSAGIVVYAGVDYREIAERAAGEADVIVWDGGNNDLPFFRPDLWITVADALRPGHELTYHPGETNVRRADVVVVNKVDAASPEAVAEVHANVTALNPSARVLEAASPAVLDPGPSLEGRRVVVVEDGPTLTHGGMPFGAGTVAARRAGAVIVDPRPHAVGTIAGVYERYPAIGAALPAMGYSEGQLGDLAATIEAIDCDAVVAGTPVDLGRLVEASRPVRRVRYSYADAGSPTLADVVAPYARRWVG